MTELNWVTHHDRNGDLEAQSAPLTLHDVMVVAQALGITKWDCHVEQSFDAEWSNCYNGTDLIVPSWANQQSEWSDDQWSAYYRRIGMGE